MLTRVTVQDMLSARDARAARQADFLRRHGMPLVSFTMNIAGDVKVNEAIIRAFGEGTSRIRRELERMHIPVVEYAETTAFTGCEALFAVQADAAALKARMCQIEESCDLGRLFDIDVIDEEGCHLSRGRERPCLICGGPVRVCARSRRHSAEELFTRAQEIIAAHFRDAFVRRIGEMAQRALLYEALTTPKPGLVDCLSTGAHRDMDLFSFAASASALRPYFEDCVRIGLSGGSPDKLQYAGLLAEDAMLAAARANTHKGAIFALGILCCAAGQCGENAALADILQTAGELGTFFLRQMEGNAAPVTGGEQQFREYGLTGARGEAASGFRTVQDIGLPALQEALQAGKSPQDAGLHALLRLMAHVQDSNIIRRAGMDGQRWVHARIRRLLEEGWDHSILRRLDDEFIARNISPGGSADLLAVTWFLHLITVEGSDAP